MSLMGKCCCGGGGGCDTAPTCACLATSISIAIPAWTYLAASCPAQTVVAHLCCFTDGGIDYQVYRTTPILVYTNINTNFDLCVEASDNVPFYFILWITRNCGSCSPCEFQVNASIVSSNQYTVPEYPPFMCYLCVKNPLAIDSSTSCDGITTNNLCSFSNTFVSNPALSFFTDADCVNCTGFLLQTYVSHLSVNSLLNNCDKPSSVTITFGTTPIVLTIT